MGLVCPEVGVDLKASNFIPETINGFLKQVSMIGDVSHRLDLLNEFVNRLQDEFNKIQVFHRELPLSMLLLKHAIQIVKQEISQCMARDAYQPVLEEFMPLKKESGLEIKKQDEEGDKKNWMSSMQLWNADDFPAASHNQTPTETLDSNSSMGDAQGCKITIVDDKGLSKICKEGPNGCVPMNLKFPSLSELRVVEKEDASVPGLSLVPPSIIKHLNEQQDSIPKELSSKMQVTEAANSSSTSNSSRQPSAAHPTSTGRKQRRCWSGELHRRFVDALTQLGGAQVATPKQIRELMGVDGLTNDEVKSHLQKYRLHTRRVPNKSNEDESSKASRSQSGSPEGPLQFPGLTSTTCGDSMEDENDDKSERYRHVHKPDMEAV